MAVYFIQAGESGPIKIGFARDARLRLAKMRVDCPTELVLLAVIPGDARYERELHERFEASQHRGEWFTPDADLLSFIATFPKPEKPGRKIKEGDHPLRQYRCERGITLQDIARMVGVSHSSISRIEERRMSPTLGLVVRLSEATGGVVTIEQIVRWNASASRAKSAA